MTKNNRTLKTLILTDSASKARALKRLIGRQCTIESTEGFLRDLPRTQLGIDVDNNFELKTITVRGKAPLLNQLRKQTFDALRIYLATEPGSEGEAFAAHYCELFGVNPESNCRVELRLMTKDGLRNAIEKARPIDKRRVEAYWTRRLVNRLVSYGLNNFLWCAMYRGLSINSMQLLVLRLLRQSEERFQLPDSGELETLPINLKSLQLWAARDLNFAAGRMVLLAKELYEGFGIEKNFSGLINYYRANELTPVDDKLSSDVVEKILTSNQLKVFSAISAQKIPFAEEYQSPNQPSDFSMMLELERLGINWTDVYSAAINSLIKNGYVERQGIVYSTTELGREVLEIIDGHFSKVLEANFFAKLEEQIRAVRSGRQTRLDVLKSFCEPFNEVLKSAMNSLGDDPKPKEPPIVESDQICDKCGRRMVIKRGRFGKFLACPGYPECKNTMPYFEYLDEKCPLCGGRLLRRELTKSRTFYACEHYPECKFGTWDEPQEKRCSECGSLMLLHRFRGRVPMLYCANEKCPTRVVHPINRILEKARQKLKRTTQP